MLGVAVVLYYLSIAKCIFFIGSREEGSKGRRVGGFRVEVTTWVEEG